MKKRKTWHRNTQKALSAGKFVVMVQNCGCAIWPLALQLWSGSKRDSEFWFGDL